MGQDVFLSVCGVQRIWEKLLLATGRRRCSLQFSLLVLCGIATCWLLGFTGHVLIETVIQFLWGKKRHKQYRWARGRDRILRKTMKKQNHQEKAILVITTCHDLRGILKRNKHIWPLIQQTDWQNVNNTRLSKLSVQKDKDKTKRLTVNSAKYIK